MALITTYDGGKAMAGYGMYDNATTFGWLMKLFGTRGAKTKCLDYRTPAGYVTFTTKTMVIVAGKAACTTQT